MMVARSARGLRSALITVGVLGLLASGCIDREVSAVTPRVESGVSEVIANNAVDSVDLLVEVDNSNSMTQNQQNIGAQLPTLINTLVNPPDANGDGTPDYPPVKHLHVGVIDQDLGTAGSSVPGCVNGDAGDDGLLNPIAFGQAESHHLPSTSAPAGFRPADCSAYPNFIAFESDSTNATQFAHDFQCNAALYINGCGLEQQLEAVWRALLWHHADDSPGNTDPNAGFLRSNALLAILMLTDEDDMSVVDCRYWTGDPNACPNPNALSVFNSASMDWSSSDLNLRTYLYQPCGAQDPTWPLDRYIDPTTASTGFLSLKPGHPELVVFAAITGVPLDHDGFPTNTDGTPDWNLLLGTPGANGANDFCGRDASSAGMSVDMDSTEGHISMRQANADPACPTARTVPACRRQGSTAGTGADACNATTQYYAYPARRVVEVARRFDQATVCGGMPCHNGLVTSICSNDYSSAMQQIIDKIQSRLTGKCLPRQLQPTMQPDGTSTVDCLVREYVPVGMGTGDCSGLARAVPTDSAATVNMDGVDYTVCDITQVAADSNGMPSPGDGWYYNQHPGDAMCAQEISFTANAAPISGSITRLECIQEVSTGATTMGM